MPRLPSALGLGGAKRTGGLDWTLNPPMRSDSPNPPSPLLSCIMHGRGTRNGPWAIHWGASGPGARENFR
eukprot:scaffold26114_cov121-Isochrysis_galbana.AAC.3